MNEKELLIDPKYLMGRDNYCCKICNRFLEASNVDFIQVDCSREWVNSNVVCICTTCSDKNHEIIVKPLASFKGRLTVVTGVMYSEKSTVTRSLFNKYKVGLPKAIWIKPDSDVRAEGYTKTNNGELFSAFTVSASRPDNALEELIKYDLIAIDEVQFFSFRIIYVIHKLLEAGKIVVANGLKLKANRSFFGSMPYLLAEADEVINLKSVCSVCQSIDTATRTKSFNQNLPSESVGGSEKYYVVCPTCDGSENESKYVKNNL